MHSIMNTQVKADRSHEMSAPGETRAERDPLWQALRDFQIDEKDAHLTFATRLARENNWTRSFARRVVEEYKRFVFLARRAGHTVTPSEEVDQAWHLHMTYTRSYWDNLCGKVLGVALHHSPTKGGRSEDAKFADLYRRTLDSYAAQFGTPPPRDIWPDVARRFQDAPNFARVNMAEHLVIPRKAAKRVVLLAIGGVVLGVGALALAGCSGTMLASTPAGTGLAVGLGVFVVVVGLVMLIALQRRVGHGTPMRDRRVSDGSSGCGYFWWDGHSPISDSIGHEHGHSDTQGHGDGSFGVDGGGSGGADGGSSGCGGGDGGGGGGDGGGGGCGGGCGGGGD